MDWTEGDNKRTVRDNRQTVEDDDKTEGDLGCGRHSGRHSRRRENNGIRAEHAEGRK